MSLLRCPLCSAPLEREEKTYRCPQGHSFDRAREGYVHLLPPNQKHARDPGDDSAMSQARNRFLSSGYYASLQEALRRLALAYTEDRPAVLDSGCGEGYYTAGVHSALREADRQPRTAGVDLSRHALRYAARREKEAEYAVASAYRLPVADGVIDLLLNCFSPLALEEFRRVLRPGGVFFYVVPGPRHLWELKEVLYETPYLNPEEKTPYDGFNYLEILPVSARLTLKGRETLQDLFRMTPYFWKTPRSGAERLEKIERVEVTAEFRIHVFRRQ